MAIYNDAHLTPKRLEQDYLLVEPWIEAEDISWLESTLMDDPTELRLRRIHGLEGAYRAYIPLQCGHKRKTQGVIERNTIDLLDFRYVTDIDKDNALDRLRKFMEERQVEIRLIRVVNQQEYQVYVK